MSYTEQALNVIREAHDFTFDGDMVGVRRALSHAIHALEAMEREPLEDVLEPDNVTDVHVMWCRTGDDEGEWRAFLNRDQIVSAERTWFGTGATIDEAIRNAIATAKGEKA